METKRKKIMPLHLHIRIVKNSRNVVTKRICSVVSSLLPVTFSDSPIIRNCNPVVSGIIFSDFPRWPWIHRHRSFVSWLQPRGSISRSPPSVSTTSGRLLYVRPVPMAGRRSPDRVYPSLWRAALQSFTFNFSLDHQFL